MKHLLILFVLAVSLLTHTACQQQIQEKKEIAQACCSEANAMATCTGSSSCTACKNCKNCKHCSKEGGSCGVCKPPSKKKK